jgi:hypothetical protein
VPGCHAFRVFNADVFDRAVKMLRTLTICGNFSVLLNSISARNNSSIACYLFIDFGLTVDLESAVFIMKSLGLVSVCSCH